MPLSKDFKSIHSKIWEIYFSQCYPNGALKLPELSNLMQLTAAEHADRGGVGFADLSSFKQSWVMNRMRIEINQLPVWSNQVEIITWIEELKGVKSLRNFELHYNGEKYLGVSTLWAVFNMETRRPEGLQIDTSHVTRYPDKHATELANRRLEMNFEETESFKSQVQFSDLDIVNHVNNVKYLEWCLNHVEPLLILENRIKSIDLNFLKELSLGDQFTIEKRAENDSVYFRIKKQDQICFVCLITLK